MTELRKAAEMALEALETIKSSCREGRTAHAENEAAIVEYLLRQALAQSEQTVSMDEYKRLQELVTSQGIRLMEYESQPEQEPVAWDISGCLYRKKLQPMTHEQERTWIYTPLYTAPPSIEAAVLAEREACAKVCENMERNGAWITKVEAAAAIRARSEK